MLDGRFRTGVDRVVNPVGNALGRTGLSPDHLTGLGLLLAVPAALAIGSGHLHVGLALLVASAVPDLLDGAVAKASGRASTRGAFFDSVADRVSDALVVGGVAWYLQDRYHGHAALLPLAVLAASFLVSYERAKAESLGLDGKGGLMERAERVVLLCVGLAFAALLVPLLWAMLGLTVVTALQRFAKVWRQAGAAPSEPPEPPRAQGWSAHRNARGTLRAGSAGRWRDRRLARVSETRSPSGERPGPTPGPWRRVNRTGRDRRLGSRRP
ncbi:MAG: CDP-alcohol phosphatidyltransferase family protein [Acidimicrobiales bacterium]